MRTLQVVVCSLLMCLAISDVAAARETTLSVQVVDQAGKPIPTAVVRHPAEKSRHSVDHVTGTWRESVLYLADGEELRLQPGMNLQLEVSAPGYQLAKTHYTLRNRKNNIVVGLVPVALPSPEEDDIAVDFGRDIPLDGR